VAYRFKLDFNKALQYFQQTVNLAGNELKAPPEVIATYNYNIAEIYYVTGNYEKAIELVNNNIKAANIDDQISYYELLAFIYQIKNDKIKSKNNYQKATNLTIEFYTEESIEAAIAYLNYSNFLISIAQFNE